MFIKTKQKAFLKKDKKPTTFFQSDPNLNRKLTFEQKTDPNRCQKANPAWL
jgi:hypothetical protein